MAFRISCPGCGQSIKVSSKLRGRKVRCKTCETVLRAEPGGDNLEPRDLHRIYRILEFAAMSDGAIQLEEQELLDSIADRAGLDPDTRRKLCSEGRAGEGLSLPKTPAGAKLLERLLVELVAADGDVDEGEIRLLKKLATKLGVSAEGMIDRAAELALANTGFSVEEDLLDHQCDYDFAVQDRPRRHHAAFVHGWLAPGAMQLASEVIAGLAFAPQETLERGWELVREIVEGEGGTTLSSDGLRSEPLVVVKVKSVLIVLPRPRARTEAIFVLVVGPATVTPRCFTLELTIDVKDDSTSAMLCEWRRGEHLNYGIRKCVDAGEFVAAVEELVS